jgi:hypothetical protein
MLFRVARSSNLLGDFVREIKISRRRVTVGWFSLAAAQNRASSFRDVNDLPGERVFMVAPLYGAIVTVSLSPAQEGLANREADAR